MLPAIFGLTGEALTNDERAFFREAEPAGFILFGRNLRTRAQARALTDTLRDLTGRANLPILIDQEGGAVARLKAPQWPVFPAAQRFGALYERAPISGMKAARANAQAIGLTLRDAGITVNCAPVLDLYHPAAHPVIGDRAFSSDPLHVASLGRAVLDGLAAGGVVGVVKHMPGHGRAAADSHCEAPLIDASEAELEPDLLPFKRLIDAPAAMTAHVRYRTWDPAAPATVSRRVVQEVIRGRIGFAGLLISDDLKMGALSGPPGERAAAAVAAGCDLALHGSGHLPDARAIADVLRPLSEEAHGRLDKAMAAAAAEPQGSVEDSIAKRDALLAV